jgi:stage III sporulation protein AE
MALMAAAVGDMGSLLETGRQTVERLTDLDRVLIPTLTTAAAASGSVSGAATRQMVTLLCANLLLSLMNSVFIPGLYLSLAASAGAAAGGDGGLRLRRR